MRHRCGEPLYGSSFMGVALNGKDAHDLTAAPKVSYGMRDSSKTKRDENGTSRYRARSRAAAERTPGRISVWGGSSLLWGHLRRGRVASPPRSPRAHRARSLSGDSRISWTFPSLDVGRGIRAESGAGQALPPGREWGNGAPERILRSKAETSRRPRTRHRRCTSLFVASSSWTPPVAQTVRQPPEGGSR